MINKQTRKADSQETTRELPTIIMSAVKTATSMSRSPRGLKESETKSMGAKVDDMIAERDRIQAEIDAGFQLMNSQANERTSEEVKHPIVPKVVAAKV